jgi:hypothetical protein
MIHMTGEKVVVNGQEMTHSDFKSALDRMVPHFFCAACDKRIFDGEVAVDSKDRGVDRFEEAIRTLREQGIDPNGQEAFKAIQGLQVHCKQTYHVNCVRRPA